MGFFKRKNKVLDLTEYSHRQKEKIDSLKQEIKEAKKEQSPDYGGIFSFFSGVGASNSNQTTTSSSSDSSDLDGSPEEKRKRLAKRLMDLTTKIEELSNQIYQVQQRLEVIEKKLSARV